MTKVKELIKKSGSYKGESNKLGKGGRFKQMVDKEHMSPKLAAWIGDKKYGSKKMHKWASSERKK